MAKLLTFCSAQRWYIPIRYLISRFIITFFLWQGKSLETSTLLQIPRLSLAFFLSLSHCEIQIQFSSREYFHYIFFPFSINVNVLSPRVQFLFIFFFSSFTPRFFCPYVTTINYPVRSFEKCTVHMLRIRCIVPAPTLFKHVPRDRAYS